MKSLIMLLVVSLLFVVGCSNPPLKGSAILGAEDFVMDSYKIAEGKFSILEMEGKPVATLTQEDFQEEEDVIHEGDVLQVLFFHPTRSDLAKQIEHISQTMGFIVQEQMIALPGVAPIKVAGLTLTQAKKKVQKAYLNEIEDSEVYLSYKERPDDFVTLTGMVKETKIPLKQSRHLFDILAFAHIPPEANYFKSYLVRGMSPIPVDMNRLIREGDMHQNVVLRRGDKIYIAPPNASRLMIMGEVGKPQVIDLPQGYLPIREALAMAGGIPYTGDKRYIQVLRGNLLKPKIYTLNWKHIAALPTHSLLLIPGDIVYVAATPITEWNRFITQLFPTFTAIELFTKGVSGVVAVQ